MKYYLVAGEASGDLHGANLMKALKSEDPDASFRYFGGDKMQAEGGTLVKHYADMAFMGFTEVLLNLRTILKNMRHCKEDLSVYQPDALILIDFPGFNMKIADYAKKEGMRVIYYISPKVWAWNQKRVLKIKRVVDLMLCILPFEVEFYASWGMKVSYVGNPLLDEMTHYQPDLQFREKYQLDARPIVALLPGSRVQEISRLLPVMLQVSDQFPEMQFVIAGAPHFDKAFYASYLKGKPVPLVFGQTYDLLHRAQAALVASGTATLETALFHVPQVVLYKGGTLSIAIARLLVKIKFISLVNLILDRPAVPELIQEDCEAQRITKELAGLLEGEARERMLHNYTLLHQRMGQAGASERSAKLILNFLTLPGSIQTT